MLHRRSCSAADTLPLMDFEESEQATPGVAPGTPSLGDVIDEASSQGSGASRVSGTGPSRMQSVSSRPSMGDRVRSVDVQELRRTVSKKFSQTAPAVKEQTAKCVAASTPLYPVTHAGRPRHSLEVRWRPSAAFHCIKSVARALGRVMQSARAAADDARDSLREFRESERYANAKQARLL